MKKSIYTALLFIFSAFVVFAQDEGAIVVKERFERDNTFYFSVGPSFTLGKNLGDYSTGFSVDGGYLKRFNKVLSIGPSISYLFFSYDPNKTFKNYYDVEYDEAIILGFTGGDISIISLGFNMKVNFIPVSDRTKFSVYGIASPFIGEAAKSEMTGTVDVYDNDGNDLYTIFLGQKTVTADDEKGFKKQSSFTGGLHAGLGIEFRPVKKISFFAQVSFSYTLPVNYIGTKSFLHDKDRYQDAQNTIYYDASTSLYVDTFPMVKKGFSTAGVKIGIAYNF